MASSALAFYDLSVGDLDRDGDLDVVLNALTSCCPAKIHVSWFRNHGGTNPFFLKVVIMDAITQGGPFKVTDVNGDGCLDIAFVCRWEACLC
jgi:hypothetical protein